MSFIARLKQFLKEFFFPEVVRIEREYREIKERCEMTKAQLAASKARLADRKARLAASKARLAAPARTVRPHFNLFNLQVVDTYEPLRKMIDK